MKSTFYRIFGFSLALLALIKLSVSQEIRFIADTYGKQINWYNSSGNLLGQFGSTDLAGPSSLFVRGSVLYVLDITSPFSAQGARIMKYSANNRSLLGITILDNAQGSVYYGSEMVISKSGIVYVSNGLDTIGQGFVDAFNLTTGQFQSRYFQAPDAGSRGLGLSKDEKLLLVGSYAPNNNGMAVYVHVIPNPTPLSTFAPIGRRVQDILVKGDTMYVAGQGSGAEQFDYLQAWQVNSNGTFDFKHEFGMTNVFGSARALALGINSDIHLTVNSLPIFSGYIKKFRDNGSSFTELSSYGFNHSQLPQGIAIAKFPVQ